MIVLARGFQQALASFQTRQVSTRPPLSPMPADNRMAAAIPDPAAEACPPVLMILFNRPELAAQVFERVRHARPARVYLAIDGPRDPARHPDDAARVARCREFAARVDWPCELRTRFSDENQGCGRGPANAVTWFFQQEEAGIILEDDCIPEESFFHFCAALLARHADDPAVMHINGNNFVPAEPARLYGPHSYGFTRYAQAWGWASWARAWRHFDYEVRGIRDEPTATFHAAGVENYRQAAHRERVVSTLDHHHHDVWDYQWQYAVMKQRGLCISPAANLISNVGFGDDATHTKDADCGVAHALTGRIDFPLKHPPAAVESPALNRHYADRMLGEASRYRKKAFRRWLRGLFGICKASR
jgi:hypothetical protein